MQGQRADPQFSVVHADIPQSGKPTDVHERRRAGETEVHHRDEALAAGDELGVVAKLGEQRYGLIGGSRTVVPERRGLHHLP